MNLLCFHYCAFPHSDMPTWLLPLAFAEVCVVSARFLNSCLSYIGIGIPFSWLFFFFNGSLDIIPNPSNPWTWCFNSLGDSFFLEELVPVITVTCVFIFVKMVFSTTGCQLTPGPLHPCCWLCVRPCTACLDAKPRYISGTRPAPPHAHQPTHT